MFGEKYHRGEDYGEKSFIDHLSGLAAFAGIAAIGLSSGRPVAQKFTGLIKRGIFSLAPGTVDHLASPGGRVVRGSIDSITRSVFSDEVHAYLGLGQMASEIQTLDLTHERTQIFSEGLREWVDEQSVESLDRSHGSIRQALREVLQHRDVEGARSSLLTSESMARVSKAAKGVKFTWQNSAAQEQVFNDLLERSYQATTERTRITKFMDDPDNRRSVLSSLIQGVSESRDKERVINNTLFNPEGYRELTFGELVDTRDGGAVLSEIGEKVEQHYQSAFVTLKAGEERKSFILGAFKQFQEAQRDLFGDASPQRLISENANEQLAFIRRGFDAAKTGIHYDPLTGNIFSSAAVRRASLDRLRTNVSTMQIPLFPGFFNAPVGNLFQFSKESPEFFKRIGYLAGQGELKRAGLFGKYGLGDNSVGVAFGRNLLAIDPDALKITAIDEKFTFMPTRLSEHTRMMAEIRSADTFNALDNALETIKEGGVFGGVKKLLSGDPNAPSDLRKLLFSNQGYLELDHNTTGLIVKPSMGSLALGLDARAIKKIYEDPTNVAPHLVNPAVLLKFLRERGDELDPHLYSQAVGAVMSQVRNTPKDVGAFLKNSADLYEGEGPIADGVRALLQAADSPEGLREALTTNGFFSGLEDTLQKEGTEDLYKAIQTIKKDQVGFLKRGSSQDGWLNRIRQGFLGNDLPSKSSRDLQNALLEELNVNISLSKLERDYGGVAGLQDFRTVLASRDMAAISQHPTYKFFAENLGLGFDHPASEGAEAVTHLMTGLFKGGTDSIDKRGLRTLASSINNIDTFSGVQGYDELIGAKNLSSTYNSLKNLQHRSIPRDRAGGGIPTMQGYVSISDKMAEIAKSDTVEIGLKKAFSGGRRFLPRDDRMTPGTGVSLYGVASPSSNISQFIDDPLGTLGRSFSKGFGAKEFIRGLIDPEAPFSTSSYVATVLGQMPDTLGRSIGLSLASSDKVTLGRSMIGFYGKRLLPVLIAYEAYKNFNTNAYDSNLPGLDTLGANALANFNLMSASVKDFLGLTRLNQGLVNSIPGLDQYFHPRSREEYEEYLATGNEGVRRNRGWVIGSRGNLTGGNVDFFRPNYYRRWKSNWTSADNIDIANPEYSFLPSIRHPLAPLNRLLNPDWFVRKHVRDRPYIPGGIDRPYRPGYAANYLTAPSEAYHDGGGAAEGTGGGYGYAPGGTGTERGMDIVGGFGGGKFDTMFVGHGFGIGGGPSGEGKKAHLSLEKSTSVTNGPITQIYNRFADLLDAYRSQTGLYGAFFKMVPGYPKEVPGYTYQDPKYATSLLRPFFMNKYGEMGLGPIGEYFRRFTGLQNQDFDSVNNLPNDQPSWMLPAYREGDPYLRGAGFEYWMPGEAFERLNPWVRPNKIRGSLIGYSEEEIIQKMLDPIGGDQNAAMNFGSEAHLMVQRKLNEAGLLIAAEVPIYDKKHNISGTIDAIVNGPNGQHIIDIKTQNPKDFAAGIVPEKYVDQITLYMGTTGISDASLAFVNSDDTSQVRIQRYGFDPERYQRILQRASNVQATLERLVGEGLISPYETYDVIARLQVLGKVAPNSREFKELLQYAQKGGLNTQEKDLLAQIKKEADLLNQDYNLYSQRYNRALETHPAEVIAVNSDGTITTDRGTVRLAGVRFDEQAFIYENSEAVLEKFGVRVGKPVNLTMLKGNFNPELLNDTTLPAIIGNVNSQLIGSEYADPAEDSKNPMDSIAVRGNRKLGLGFLESVLHSDNLVSNKFLRVRTPLEQFERGEVYGTDYFSWADPWHTLIKPTINSFIAKNPLTGAGQAALAASLFFNRGPVKMRVAMWAAAIIGTLSGGRALKDFLQPNHPWTPRAYDRQTEVDEYYDMLEYVKQTSIANAAKEEAYVREGVNLDSLRNSDQREFSQLGPYAMMAVEAERKAKRTMYGIEVSSASLQDVIAAIPKRHRQIAEEIVTSGAPSDKRRFYALLPDHEKRILGKFLGVNQQTLPNVPDLTKYFKTHNLPDVDWAGWCVLSTTLINMGDLSQKKAQDICVGDEVITQEGPKKVQQIYTREAKEEEYTTLTIIGGDTVGATAHHKVLVADTSMEYQENIRYSNHCKIVRRRPSSNVVCWKSISEIKSGDYIASPRFISKESSLESFHPRNNTPIPLTEDLCYVIGLYIAEGNLKKSSTCPYHPIRGIEFTLNLEDEEYLALKVQKILLKELGVNSTIKARIKKTGNSLSLVAKTSWVGELFYSLVGEYSNKKQLSDILLNLPRNQIISLLKGYIDGDGHYGKDGRISVASVSFPLALQIWSLLGYLGIPSVISKKTRKNRKPSYRISFVSSSIFSNISDVPKRSHNNVIITENYIFSRVQNKISTLITETVFDFMIEGCHMYSSGILTLHNSPNVDLDDVKTVGEQAEGARIENPTPKQVAKARVRSMNTEVPRMDHHTAGLISARIRKLLATGGLENFSLDVNVVPADDSRVNVNLHTFIDRTHEILNHIQEDARRA